MNENEYAEQLIKEYSSKEVTKFDELKALDRKVKKPALILAYTLGIIASLVLGFGMCLAMQVIWTSTILMFVGIGIGLVGIGLCALNYKIYEMVLNKRKAKYSDEILAKSNELLNK